jgi:prophage regulatory protein
MSIEAAVHDEVARELHRIMNVSKFGEQIIAERLRDAVLKLSVVSAITGLPASTLYRKIQHGEFPAPIKLGESASGWLMSEVDAWIAARREERDAAAREALARKALAAEMTPPSPPHRPEGGYSQSKAVKG